MRIGEFSKFTGISLMTARYYADIGLLTPCKKKGYWEFDTDCVEAIEKIAAYKACGFSIKTIQNLFQLDRGAGLSATERASRQRELIQAERMLRVQEKSDIEESIRLVEQRISTGKSTIRRADAHGVPFELFRLIGCPHCDKPLDWENAYIVEQTVKSGNGKCGCGFRADIEKGILHVLNIQRIHVKSLYSRRENLLNRTARDISYIEEFHHWICAQLFANDLTGKVIHEDVINLLCFLNRAVDKLDPNAFYVLSDVDPRVVKYHMENIYALRPDCKALFIVDDGVHHPIRHGSVDVQIDYCASEICQLYGFPSSAPINKPYAHKGTIVTGRFSYLIKRQDFKSKQDRSGNPLNPARYQLSAFKANLAENGIKLLKEKIGNQAVDESVYDGSLKGDVLSLYGFFGKWE